MFFIIFHFTLQGSREQQALKTDERFWPILGGNTLRGIKDCILFPITKITQISGVKTLPFEIGAGASHVGMCTAEILDLKGNLVQTLNSQLNCVSGPKAMTVNLPMMECSHCILKVKVTATHRGPGLEEYFDSCLDVEIHVKNQPNQQPLQRESIPDVIPQPTLPTTTTTAKTTKNSRRKTCSKDNHGQRTCSLDKKQILVCDWTRWIKMDVASGTLCQQNGDQVLLVSE